MRTTDPNTAVAYIRASTEEQTLGPQAQEESLRAFAERQGLHIVAIHHDLGVSGGTPPAERPGLMGAIADLEVHGAGVLLVAKRDRLARDTFAAGMIARLAQRIGASVWSADGVGNDDTPEGQLHAGLMDLFAQYERACIRFRTRAALAVKKRKGQLIGSVPYGSRLAADGIHLEPHPKEQKAARVAAKLRKGGLSLRAVGAELDEQGTFRRNGTRWHPESVKALLRVGGDPHA